MLPIEGCSEHPIGMAVPALESCIELCPKSLLILIFVLQLYKERGVSEEMKWFYEQKFRVKALVGSWTCCI